MTASAFVPLRQFLSRGGAKKVDVSGFDGQWRLQRRAAGSDTQAVQDASKDEDYQKDDDDGRVLDPSAPVGVIGALAVSIAILPYFVISLYSSITLVTTGAGLPSGPNGLYGLAEGIATLIVFVVVLWSLSSFLTRARGLPEGPFNALGLTQNLSYFCALVFAGAVWLNSGNASDNPLRGLSFGSNFADLEKASVKVQAVGAKYAEVIERETAGPRAQLENEVKKAVAPITEKVAETSSKVTAPLSEAASSVIGTVADATSKVKEKAADATSEASSKVSEFKVPDFKLPELKLPDMKFPDFTNNK